MSPEIRPYRFSIVMNDDHLPPTGVLLIASAGTFKRSHIFSNNFLLYAYCLTALWVTFGPWHIGMDAVFDSTKHFLHQFQGRFCRAILVTSLRGEQL